MSESSDRRQRTNFRGTPRSRLISSVVMLVMVAAGVVLYSIRKSDQLFDLGLQAQAKCGGSTQPLGPRFAPMLQPLLDAAGNSEAVSAHECSIDGRDYIAVVMRKGAAPVSVILTEKRDQEIFPRAFAGQTEEIGGITLHETRRSEQSVAAFESGNWLAYIISGTPPPQNAEIARKLVPVIGGAL